MQKKEKEENLWSALKIKMLESRT